MEYNHVTPAVVADLEAIVGAKYVWTDRDKKIPYGQDEGTGPACLPDVVVLPASAEELAAGAISAPVGRRDLPEWIWPQWQASLGDAAETVALAGTSVMTVAPAYLL